MIKPSDISQYVIDAFKGKPITLSSIEKYKPNSPLLELEHSFTAPPIFTLNTDVVMLEDNWTEDLFNSVLPHYQNWGKYGPYGDVIMLTRVNQVSDTGLNYATFIITGIAHVAWPKPALAADLLPFVVTKNANYFIGIVRGKDPGKGLPALIGGHRDVKGMHFETAAEALIHEGFDESSLIIKTCNEIDQETLIEKPNAPSIPVEVILGEHNQYTDLLYAGTFHTSSVEEEKNLGRKRVYQTTAYYLIIHMNDQELTENDIYQMLTADDDAADIHIHQVQGNKPPKFGIAHHTTIYRATIERIRQEMRMKI